MDDRTDRLDDAIDQVVRQMMAGEGPRDLRRRVLRRLAEPEPAPAWWLGWRTSRMVWAAAAAILIGFIAFTVWWAPQPATQVAAGPASLPGGLPPVDSRPAPAPQPAPPLVAERGTAPASNAPDRLARPRGSMAARRGTHATGVAVHGDSAAAAAAASFSITPLEAALEAVTLAPVEHAELTFQELSFAPLEIRAMELPALNAGSTPPSPR